MACFNFVAELTTSKKLVVVFLIQKWRPDGAKERGSYRKDSGKDEFKKEFAGNFPHGCYFLRDFNHL
jgi:hypothetical protein